MNESSKDIYYEVLLIKGF